MLRLTDAVAALLLAADLVVVIVSVVLRSTLNAPVLDCFHTVSAVGTVTVPPAALVQPNSA